MRKPFNIAEGIVLQRNGKLIDDRDDPFASAVIALHGIENAHLKITRIRQDGYVEFDILDGPKQGWGCLCHRDIITSEWFIPD